MNITDPFVLGRDVLLIPCTELSEDMRSRISFDEGDFTLSRRHGRTLSQVIDGETAALLALFREPRTIVDAVIENSRALGRSADARLDELLPHLGTFLQNSVLVPAGAAEEQEIRPRYESGESVAGWTIVRCASLIEDTEIYQVRRGEEAAALKIARLAEPRIHALLENERVILGRLGGGIAPRLLDAGVDRERPFLLIDWIDGVDSGVAAAQRRHDRAAVIDMCASIAAAYAELHARGVLHGDVHPRNVLVGERVRLVDFGISRFADEPPRVGRGGMYYFFEPELLAAGGQWVLPPSAAGEQYALAALLYLLMTGQHYLDFRYEREEMARQVVTEPPVPFAKRGLPPWPAVEEVLFRALEKEPARRHESIAAMAALLADARDTAVRESLAAPLTGEAHALLESTLASFRRGGAMFVSRYPEPPLASINYGAAGAAVGLLRIAETRSDPALLALADIWRSRAAALVGRDDAFCNPAREIPRELVGEVSPYHTEAGIHATGALIAAAFGSTPLVQRAIGAFLHASSRPSRELDLVVGRAGSVLASAMLLPLSDDPALRAFGTAALRLLWDELDTHAALDGYLGMAHGWAGYFYATLRWCDASGDPLPPRLLERLDDYTALRTLRGRGAYWRVTAEGPEHAMMPSWCNGSAGQVFLFTLAHRMLGDERWLRLAESCAWTTWDEPRTLADLCCGTAGRAYALLNLYRHTGATEWLSRARQLANHAAAAARETAAGHNALWKGELGVAVLISDVASPENARMPFFE